MLFLLFIGHCWILTIWWHNCNTMATIIPHFISLVKIFSAWKIHTEMRFNVLSQKLEEVIMLLLIQRNGHVLTLLPFNRRRRILYSTLHNIVDECPNIILYLYIYSVGSMWTKQKICLKLQKAYHTYECKKWLNNCEKKKENEICSSFFKIQ